MKGSILTAAILVFAICGCIGFENQPGKADVYADLGQPFSLKLNQSAFIPSENLQILFQDVPSDSRCPSDVQCIWAGEVKVSLMLKKGRNGPAAAWHTNLSIVKGAGEESGVETFNDALGNRYTVKLVRVEPYPKSNQQIDARNYTVTLEISKNP